MTFSYDPNVPDELKRTQQWFGSIIERPIDQESRMMPLSPSGKPMEDEACQYITPSPTLAPHERIELYNQQYWWRLLSILHENYPGLTRLFGYRDFNERIAFPYICRYRPDDWSLAHLGSHLPQFLKDIYQGEDRQLVIDTASLDYAYLHAFLAQGHPSLALSKAKTTEALTQMLSQTIHLQEHVHLFDFSYHLFDFREALISEQDGDHFLEHPFPKLDSSRTFQFVLYRNTHNRIMWKEISTCEYILLRMFGAGCSISEACDQLSNNDDDPLVEQALANIHLWLQEWTLCGLLRQT